MTEDLKISALFGMEESWKTLRISPIMIVVWSISCIITAYYEGVKEDMQKDAAADGETMHSLPETTAKSLNF